MPNHYHLYVETPDGNLTRFIQNLDSQYAQQFNRRYHRVGPLWQGRYKAILVEKESYALELSRYIHLNPVKAKLVRAPEDYVWSSYAAFLNQRSPEIFHETKWLLSQIGCSSDKAREALHRFTLEGLCEVWDPEDKALGGLLLGSMPFINWAKREYVRQSSDRSISRLREIQKPMDIEHIREAVACLTEDPTLQRKLWIFALKRYTPLTLREIGRKVGGMSAVAVSQVARRLAQNAQRNSKVARMTRELAGTLCQM